MEDLKTNLRKIVAKSLRLESDPAEIGDMNLISTLGIDSISSMEILIWVEDEFNITIEDEDLSPALVDSLDTLATYVESRINV